MASKKHYIKYCHTRTIIPTDLNSDNTLVNGKEDRKTKLLGNLYADQCFRLVFLFISFPGMIDVTSLGGN
jgi:hypothetical protein